MDWTPEKIKELRRLWAKGLSSGDIGRLLGVSKNAIVGKVHRLELESRPSPILGGKEEIPDPPKKTVSKKATKSAKKTAPSKKATEKKTIEEEKEGTQLVDLTPNSCRWPMGDPKNADFVFCGKKVVPGKIYCAEHCAVAYSTLLKTK